MTIETILIINYVTLAVCTIALVLCMVLWQKDEKKITLFKEKEAILEEELKIKTEVYEDIAKAAYELGYNESKCAVQQKIAFEFYEKVLEWHPVTKIDKYSYLQFIELFKKWSKDKYGIDVIEVKDGE